MATFVPYLYVPTPSRRTAPARSNPASQQSSNESQLQRRDLGEKASSTPQTAGTGGCKSKLRDTGTIDDDGDEFPTIEQLFRDTLQREDFTAGGQRPIKTYIEATDAAAKERCVTSDNCGLAPSGNSDDPIVLLVDNDNPSIPESAVDTGLYAESVTCPPSPAHLQPDEWAGINDLFETAQPPSSNPSRPHASPPPRASIEPPSDCTSAAAPSMVRTGSEVTTLHPTACPAHPLGQTSAQLPVDQTAIDELEPIRPGTSSVVLRGDKTQGQAQELEDEDSNNDCRRPQQKVGEDAAAALMPGGVENAYLSSQMDEGPRLVSLASPQPSRDKSRSQSNNHSDGDLDSPESADEDEGPLPAPRKRIRPPSHNNGPTPKKQKRKHHHEQKSVRQQAQHLGHRGPKISAQHQSNTPLKHQLSRRKEPKTYGGMAEDSDPAAVESVWEGGRAPARRPNNSEEEGEAFSSSSTPDSRRFAPMDDSDSDSGPTAGGHDESEDELASNKCHSQTDTRGPQPTKRKRGWSSCNDSMPKKPRYHLQPDARHKRRAYPGSLHHSPKSPRPFKQSSRPPAADIAAWLPSPAPSASRALETDLARDCHGVGGLSQRVLPTLTEVTFRPHSLHCSSFSAVIRESCQGQGVSFSQLTRLLESIGHIGRIDDFTFIPSQSRSFLITGFTQHPSSQTSSSRATGSTAGPGHIHRNTERTRPQDGRAVDVGSFVSQSGPASSDGDSGLSGSDPEYDSDDGGYSTGDERGYSETSRNTQWQDVDELRLLTYKTEGKSWDWIVKKFPGRTENAIRSRWTIAKRKHR